MRSSKGIGAALVLASLALAAPAQAAVTSTTVGLPTMTGDAANDTIRISSAPGSGKLRHNLVGGAFNSPTDFDTLQAGDQELTNVAGTQLIIIGGDGDDVVEIGATPPATDRVDATISVDGGNNDDELNVYGLETADTVTLQAGSITGLTGAPVAFFPGTDRPQVFTNGGNDQVTAQAVTTTSVYGGGDNDTLALPDGTGVKKFHGETGTDTLDYSARTTAVTIGPPTQAYFVASLDGAQQVPPAVTARTGIGQLIYDMVANKFTYSLFLQGFAPADVSDSHIHSAPAGTNGSVIFPIGPGAGYTAVGPNLFKVDGPVSAPVPSDITEPVLRAGNLYFNVHNSAGGFPNGEIRGQIGLDQSNKYVRPSTSVTTGTVGVESVIGSSAGDTINGIPVAETIDGGPGADTIEGDDGNDTLTGGGGADTVRGGLGDDTLNGGDGVTDAELNCGGGTDVLNRDVAAVDPDSIISGCETVNPATAAPDTTAKVTDPAPKASGKKKIVLDTGSTATCPRDATSACTLTASATASVPASKKRRKLKLASLTLTINPGASQPVVLTASKKASKKFRAAGRVPVTFIIDLTAPGGQPASTSKTVKLKPPK
ncbi:MAG: hypothetical protein QOG62_1203 [Thermoleophilaceae bacterium]|jgi:Ca2+-binding RTX toxin-like protein|nr:hypothetical protein [Thermoleophilaceae bacterium]